MINTEQTLEIPASLRFRLLTPCEAVREVVYVLHGYGQLVEYFSQKFQGLGLKNTLFVFPEGRHRFYLKGSSGRVGASWMTKEWREEDIRLNILALDLLHREISLSYPEIGKTTVLGFSQGGATAARWLAHGTVSCDHFISWASVYPPDLAIEDHSSLAAKSSFVLGTQDEFFTADAQESLIEEYRSKGINTIRFEGTHDIHPETLIALL